MSEESLDAIRYKLQHGVPPLSDEECLLLFKLATGEEIARRKRCRRCNATGEVLVQGPLHESDAATKECTECGGSGYVERSQK